MAISRLSFRYVRVVVVDSTSSAGCEAAILSNDRIKYVMGVQISGKKLFNHTFSSVLVTCFVVLLRKLKRPRRLDAKLSVDDELLTTVCRLNGRFFGLFRGTFVLCDCCFPYALLLLLEQIETRGKNSVELVFVGDGTATAN